MVGSPSASSVSSRETCAAGFLTAVDSPSHGIFGGYLLVDTMGRPLEFYCTAPIRVSRAQQILYGHTLESHLHGKQIGATLIEESSLEPRVVLTDLPAMLHAGIHTSVPLGLVKTNEEESSSCELGMLRIGSRSVRFDGNNESLVSLMRERLSFLDPQFDVAEPFERIRAAIEEAQKR